jgi:hypothetical protein
MYFLIAAITLTFRESAGEKEDWQAAKTKIPKIRAPRISPRVPVACRLTEMRQADWLPAHPRRRPF